MGVGGSGVGVRGVGGGGGSGVVGVVVCLRKWVCRQEMRECRKQ